MSDDWLLVKYHILLNVGLWFLVSRLHPTTCTYYHSQAQTKTPSPQQILPLQSKKGSEAGAMEVGWEGRWFSKAVRPGKIFKIQGLVLS